MSNRRGKLIVNESDEEVEDSYPNQLRPTGPLHPSSSVGPSYDRDTPEYPRPKAILPSSDFEPMGNRGGQASGSGENHSSEGARVPEEVGDGEESSSKLSRPSKKRNISHRMEADAYLIDYITCATTHTDLLKLRNLYNIPEEVLLVIPGKGDVPSRPPNGYVTMHLESFKLRARLPLQPYFARILGGMYLALESWGLIKNLDDTPLLNVKTALVNASTCQDLLSSTNLVRSRLVDVAAGMDNKILSAMSRKRARGSAPAPTLPPPPPRKNGGEKVCDKSPEISVQSRDRSSPLPPRDQGDYLSPYQRDYGKSVGPKMVEDIESMNLSELAGYVQRVSFKLATLVSCYKNKSTGHERRLQADNQDLTKKAESADRSKEKLLELHKQIMDMEEKMAIAESNSSKLESELGDLKFDLQATQSERDTLKTTLEEQIKSLNDQVAELKGKSTEVDNRLDAEYNSGLAFCYKCIMFVLKEEYPELNMSKLDVGVQKYMAESDQVDKDRGDQDQVEAPSSGVQEEEAGDHALEAGQGSMPAPPEVAGSPLSEIVDLSPAEAAEPHNP
ncbi:uncharacterized protein LOC112098185 [Citrus clementina]|uniref:uncharacterized protein LOC112098185 n=1 Tax=Citrus clementina TaxID=85681 RepID=UPI000CED1B4D|nr:uncharacterized protein LOC112098185 [Citrus x clementina]